MAAEIFRQTIANENNTRLMHHPYIGGVSYPKVARHHKNVEHTKDEMITYEAPCIIPPLAEDQMFRVAFDAEARFACDEDGIFVPPKQSALMRLTNLAQQVLQHTREMTAKREATKDSRRNSRGRFFGRNSMFRKESKPDVRDSVTV